MVAIVPSVDPNEQAKVQELTRLLGRAREGMHHAMPEPMPMATYNRDKVCGSIAHVQKERQSGRVGKDKLLFKVFLLRLQATELQSSIIYTSAEWGSASCPAVPRPSSPTALMLSSRWRRAYSNSSLM